MKQDLLTQVIDQTLTQNNPVLSREEIFIRLKKGELTREQAELLLLKKPRNKDLEIN